MTDSASVIWVRGTRSEWVTDIQGGAVRSSSIDQLVPTLSHTGNGWGVRARMRSGEVVDIATDPSPTSKGDAVDAIHDFLTKRSEALSGPPMIRYSLNAEEVV